MRIVGKTYNEIYDNTEALMSAAETIFEEALWAEEAEDRIDAYDKGMLQADSAEAVFQRINTR